MWRPCLPIAKHFCWTRQAKLLPVNFWLKMIKPLKTFFLAIVEGLETVLKLCLKGTEHNAETPWFIPTSFTRLRAPQPLWCPLGATFARLSRQWIGCVADLDPQQFDQGVGRAVGYDHDRLDAVLASPVSASVRKRGCGADVETGGRGRCVPKDA